MPSSDQIYDLLELRTLVAVLGERATPQWWRTQFLTDVGFRALIRVFPRTAASVALNSVLIAARADHDKRIGVGHRYHLFRLPPNMEHAVSHLLAQEAFPARAADIVSKGREDLISALATMAHGHEESSADGPIMVGSTDNILNAGVESLATHYRHSFQTNRRVFPYFDDTARGA
jgi:hypothetical protein